MSKQQYGQFLLSVCYGLHTSTHINYSQQSCQGDRTLPFCIQGQNKCRELKLKVMLLGSASWEFHPVLSALLQLCSLLG